MRKTIEKTIQIVNSYGELSNLIIKGNPFLEESKSIANIDTNDSNYALMLNSESKCITHPSYGKIFFLNYYKSLYVQRNCTSIYQHFLYITTTGQNVKLV